MIKGAQKRMIVIRTKSSRYFDEAYFVLRNDVRSGTEDPDEMVREANRILEESRFSSVSKKRRRRGLFSFAGGVLCGAAIVGLLVLLL